MLERLFIKNYKDLDDSEVRNKYAITSGYFGICTNTILAILKLVLGLFSHSISIMADAVNNLSDMISSILTVIGFKISNKKPDKHHPYGHARYEYLLGVIIAFLMLEFGLIFAYESINKIIHPEELNLSIIVYIILVVSILLKIAQMYVYKDYSKKINSKTLKALSVDTKNDILSTSVILIAMIVMGIFEINIDGFLGLVVSLFVIYSSINALLETTEPLIGVRPSKKDVKNIKKKLLSYEFVLGIHDLMIHNYGVLNNYVTVHIELDSSLSMMKAHDLIDKIENDFKDEMDIQITIHVDPVIVGNKKLDKIKEDILSKIQELDSRITIHDFRVLHGKYKKKILFDAVVPFDSKFDEDYLENYLKKKFKNYDFDIELDRPYC